MENHSFSVEQAILFTQEGATLLQHHYFWHKKNKANNRNFHDGRYWSFNSASAFTEVFPYLSEKQIRTLHTNFIECGILVRGNYNKYGFDRTQWFALTDFGISLFENWDLQKAYTVLQKVKWILQNVKSKSQKVKSMYLKESTIPVVNTDNKTDINTDIREGEISISHTPSESVSFENEKRVIPNLWPDDVKIENLEKNRLEQKAKIESGKTDLEIEVEKLRQENEKLQKELSFQSKKTEQDNSLGGGGGENSLENATLFKTGTVEPKSKKKKTEKPKRQLEMLYTHEIETELPKIWPVLCRVDATEMVFNPETNGFEAPQSKVIPYFKQWYEGKKETISKVAVAAYEKRALRCDPNATPEDAIGILLNSMGKWEGLFPESYFADKAKNAVKAQSQKPKNVSVLDSMPYDGGFFNE